MTTYKGLPGPVACDYWTREASAAHYDDGSTFQIGRIDMVANTGTYLDSPFHRFEDGADLAGLELGSLAALEGLVVRKPRARGLAIDAADFAGLEIGGKAVLFHTGWDAYWRTEAYFENHPFVTAEAARRLIDGGAKLVLGAGVPICEHMTNLGALPDQGFRFTAAPPKIAGMGTFPVRAFAEIA